jgi:RNA polymerase sigma factor (sigma-70 family)
MFAPFNRVRLSLNRSPLLSAEKEVSSILEHTTNLKGKSYQSQLEEVQPLLHSFIKGRIRNQSDVFDIVQESNKVLINKEEDYNSDRSFKGWALGIAKWQILAYFKRQKRAVCTSSLDENVYGSASSCTWVNPQWLADVPFSSLIKKERFELIKNLNHILSNRQKQVFNLLIEDFSHQEIADKMETSKVNVQVLKARLIKRIRNFISNNKNENYNKY